MYLQREDMRKAIGAKTEYDECAWPQGFTDSGDGMNAFLSYLICLFWLSFPLFPKLY